MLGMLARPHAATVDATSSAANAQFPASNLVNNDYGRVAKFTSTAVGQLVAYLDLGAAKTVDTIALLWHNLRSTDTIQIGAGTSLANALAGASYNSAVLNPITGTSARDTATAPSKFLLTLSTPITQRYWAFKMNIVSTVHPTGVQASRAFVGQRHTFAIGPQSAELGAMDYNQKIELETGEERSSEDPLLIRPTCLLDFKYGKESDMATLLGQYVHGRGVSLPVLISADLTATNQQDQIVFGRMDKIMNMRSSTYDMWEFQASVKSFGP